MMSSIEKATLNLKKNHQPSKFEKSSQRNVRQIVQISLLINSSKVGRAARRSSIAELRNTSREFISSNTPLKLQLSITWCHQRKIVSLSYRSQWWKLQLTAGNRSNLGWKKLLALLKPMITNWCSSKDRMSTNNQTTWQEERKEGTKFSVSLGFRWGSTNIKNENSCRYPLHKSTLQSELLRWAVFKTQ